MKCNGQLPEGKTVGICGLCYKNAYLSDTGFAKTGVRHQPTTKATIERRREAAAAK